MAPPKELGSPIEPPVRRSAIIPGALFTSASLHTDPERGGFIKYGSPYDQEGRLFFGLNPPWNSVHAIEFKEGHPVGFITHQKVDNKNLPLDRIRNISHENVLGFKEVFILKDNIYFLQDQWGLTLNEILHLSPIFTLSKVEVAVICRAILQGLTYIHEQIDISYGNLTCSNVLINEQGEVKIAGVGNSILQKPNPLGKSRDIQAVCHIARKLLRVEETIDVRGTTGLPAEDFADAPPTATAKTLLQHPFLKVSATQWCLRPLHILFRPALAETLRDLGLDYLDLYLMHWPVAFKAGTGYDIDIDHHSDLLDTWSAMENLVREGLVRQIGISNFNQEQAEQILYHATIPPMAHEFECHIYLQQPEFVRWNLEQGMRVIAYSPLGNMNPIYNSSHAPLLQDSLLLSFAKKKGLTVAQLVLAWGMHRGVVVIPKSEHTDRVAENFEAQSVHLMADDIDTLNSLDEKVRFNNPSKEWGVRLYSGLDGV